MGVSVPLVFDGVNPLEIKEGDIKIELVEIETTLSAITTKTEERLVLKVLVTEICAEPGHPIPPKDAIIDSQRLSIRIDSCKTAQPPLICFTVAPLHHQVNRVSHRRSI